MRSRIRLDELDGGDLTIGEAAAALGIHKNALRRWPPDELPFHVVGTRRDRRYAAADVADYLESRFQGLRRDVGLGSARRLEWVKESQEIQRAMALAARKAALAGDEAMARRLRHVRSIVNERLGLRSN